MVECWYARWAIGHVSKSLHLQLPTSACDFELSCWHVNMSIRIDALAKCELRSVIRFYQAEGKSAAEIPRRMNRVYGKNFMSDGVREWCRKFKDV
ncbi:hypothetical protein AVEN_259838-1 [Araneus ventricosus]|uniref:Mos1 transposase HTH domain-containing protein n=1 Tax=Araneus ventricosus TaxID=182803 RepID=A0A4Y2NXL7_ARAVE|nr:hypothetical protein AVEN_259838-1 [Araneus ventricosus]